MGFISRKVLPACGNMCVCCPALRPSSRQPVKRYKKLLSQIFPKTLDGPPNERKILKLCEYAARNPLRIPKIAKFLEQRSYKELRCEHINFLKIITETYSKMLCICKEQMAYFAVSLLNVIVELLDNKRSETIRILGCQTLTTFIYCQADGTYAHNIENLVHRVCILASEGGEEDTKRRLRATSLQCLSAMVWIMTEFSHFFAEFDEIVTVSLNNYDAGQHTEDDDERREAQHNWVDEVVRCEARGLPGLGGDVSPGNHLRPRPEIKDTSLLTREESETPEIWAQICIQKIVEMAKESSTMRRILEPMLMYLDTGKHWVPDRGLSIHVLSDILYWVKGSGNEQVIFAAVIRHLDHKNIVHDPQVKSDMIQIATALVRQLRSQSIVLEIGVISDLCRHLRKSLQATVEVVGPQESSWNASLQSSIQSCLLEISRGIDDPQPLFDLMAITLEELPAIAIVSRATIGSLLILAHIVSVSIIHSHSQSQMVFPEALLLQLLKAMMHPDVETRMGGHQIFSILLVRTHGHKKQEYIYEPRKWQSKNASAFASATALLEKLRREKECLNPDKHAHDAPEDAKEKEMSDEDCKLGLTRKSSPNFYKISCSIIERTAASASPSEPEMNITMLSEDQISQLLSAFWMQASQPDNLPYNFEAIAHSYSLTLLSSRLKSLNPNIIVHFFQLPLSLRNLSLDIKGVSSATHQRSIFTLSMAMLGFAGKIYHTPELTDSLKSLKSTHDDPYLCISDDSQVYVRPLADMKEYNSEMDQKAASVSLTVLRKSADDFGELLQHIVAENLCSITDFRMEVLDKLLSETFTPDDELLFGPKSVLDWVRTPEVAHSEESLSFDEECSRSSSVGGDIISGSPALDLPQYLSKMSTLPSLPHVISVGQLLESALQVAGQVAGTCVSTSPLPYGTMASQCEALGVGTRKKLSCWLGSDHEMTLDKASTPLCGCKQLDGGKEWNAGDLEQEGFSRSEPWLALRLPPASPFDNFLKAARF